MNKYIIMLMGLLIPQIISSCPTCVGQLEQDSPSFFSDEFYQEADHQPFDESERIDDE